MSSSRKRTEHIERIRYPNPLPLPPYPPKLLAIPTPASRFADPRRYGPRLAQAHPLPVVVDAEAGMPLNLTDFPQAWYTDQELEADDDVFPRLETAEADVDPEDAFLLSDMLDKLPSGSTTNGVAIKAEGGGPGVVDSTNITWLRRTEYLATEQQKRIKNDLAAKGLGETIDASKEAQLARIKDTFRIANQPLEGVRHPTKSGVRAVESFSLLPDPDTWATRFDVFRFGDLPGRTQDNKALHDPRLHTAILRPHVDLIGKPLYSLFLVDAPRDEEEGDEEKKDDEDDKDDEGMFGEEDEDEDGKPAKKQKTDKIKFRSAEETIALEDANSARLEQSRRAGMLADAEAQNVESAPFDIDQSEEDPLHLQHIRDYEAHDESTRKDQELIFTFIDQESTSNDGMGSLPPVSQFERSYRRKGATSLSKEQRDRVVYYHPVSMRASLRVRRRRVNDPRPPEHWDAIALNKRSLSMYEKVDRLHVRATVDDMDREQIPERIELPAEDTIEEEQEDGEGEADDDAGEAEFRKFDDAAPLTSADQGKAMSPGSNMDEEEKQGGDEEEKDDENEDDDGDGGNGSGSGSDSEAQSDEEMDDDELAALRAEAGQDATNEDNDEDEGAGVGSRRRSRRGAAATNNDDNETEPRAPREPLSMDVDEED